MELCRLAKRLNEVLAPLEYGEDGNQNCPVLDYLREYVPANMRGSAKGFKILFQRYAESGRQGLTVELFHEANREEGIWEFVKGRLRVFCFLDGGSVVILAHAAIKKTNKAKSSDVKVALEIKRQYLKDKVNGQIKITELKDYELD